MDKLINDRKKQLLDMQQMLRMQDLLEQYDRQNLFLNRQVDTLLKQNLILKEQKSIFSSPSSHLLKTGNYFSRGSKNGSIQDQQAKSLSYQKSRKSRFQYMYDEDELRDLKSNLKNEIKRDANKNIYNKQIQTNIEELNINVPSKIHEPKTQLNKESKNQLYKQTRIHVNKPQQVQKSSGQKFTPIKRQSQSFMAQSKQLSPSKSKSKSKQKQQQKIQVSLKSKLYEQPKPILSTSAKTHSPKFQQQKSEQKQQFTLKQIQQAAQLMLEHSFGNKSAQRLQKKFTIMESDLNLSDSQQQKPSIHLTQSRMSNKFLPLSIQSKQLSKDISINLSRNELQRPGLSIYSDPAPRTDSKQKRNHSLNPSPKVQFNPNQFVSYKIKPFILKTQQVIPSSSGPSMELHPNPSQKIKRKFIKIISSHKIPVVESPKK